MSVVVGGLRLTVPASWVAGPDDLRDARHGLVVTVTALPADDEAGDDLERGLLSALPRADVVDREAVVVAGRPAVRLLLDHPRIDHGCHTTELWHTADTLLTATVPTLAYPAVRSDLAAVVASAAPA